MIFSLSQNRPMVDSNPSAMFAERRLKKACEYVTKFWFPANPIVLDRIRTGLDRGLYSDASLVFDDITSDYSIYIYCLRGLSVSYYEQLGKVTSLSPRELFTWAGLSAISALFAEGGLDRTPHTLANSSADQVFYLGFSLTVASAASLLLGGDIIKSECGYAAGLLRHLGINLITWNYPQVFEEAKACVRSDEPMAMVLERVLGFTPATLSARLVKEWHINPLIEQAVASEELALSSQQLQQVPFSEIERACSLGDSLARANSPENFPSAVLDWKTSKPEMDKRIGRSACAAIKRKLGECAQFYMKISPRTFSGLDDFDPEAKLPAIVEDRATGGEEGDVDHNLAHLLEPLYARYESGKVNIELVQQLIREVLPKLGFEGGCIYVVDPTNEVLAPRIKIGKLRLQSFRAVSYAENSFELSPVRNAFSAREPLLSGGSSMDGAVTCVAGHLGNRSKAGVLYLECSVVQSEETDKLLTQQFKSLCQALNKFLMLP